MTWGLSTLHLPEIEEVEEDCSLLMPEKEMCLRVVQMLEEEQCQEVVQEEEENQRVRAIYSEPDLGPAVCQNQILRSKNLNQICTKNPPTLPVETMTTTLQQDREPPAGIVEVHQDCSEQDPDLAVVPELVT